MAGHSYTERTAKNVSADGEQVSEDETSRDARTLDESIVDSIPFWYIEEYSTLRNLLDTGIIVNQFA